MPHLKGWPGTNGMDNCFAAYSGSGVRIGTIQKIGGVWWGHRLINGTPQTYGTTWQTPCRTKEEVLALLVDEVNALRAV
jgi:hypothetical protein